METDKDEIPTETEKYKGLNEAFEKFKHDFINEREKLLFSIGYKLGYDNTPTDTDTETNYLLQGKNGERLRESIEQTKDTGKLNERKH